MSVCWGSGWFLKDFLTGLAHIMPRTEYCFWKTALESEKKVFAALHVYKFKHCLSLPGSVLKPGPRSGPWPAELCCPWPERCSAVLLPAQPTQDGPAVLSLALWALGWALIQNLCSSTTKLLCCCFSAFRNAFAELLLPSWAWTKPGCYQSSFNSWFFRASHIILLNQTNKNKQSLFKTNLSSVKTNLQIVQENN